MAAEIALHPDDDRGREILDELEKRTELEPDRVDGGTRRYYLPAEDAEITSLDAELDKIDSDWRNHLANLAGQRGD